MFFKNKAILLIHGFVGGIYDYNNFQNELQIYKNFDVFTFTLPGHEKTIVKDVKYEQWINEAEKQIEFLINNKYKTIYIIGHSMGGVIATHLAKKYKEVKKLVLAAPAFRYFYFKDGKFNIKGFNESIKNIPETFKNLGTEKIIDKITKTPITTVLEFTKLINKYENEIKDVNCPTLIIHGINDNVAPQESTDYAYQNNTAKTVILYNIKNVTHDCFKGERQKETKQIIKTFLIKHPKKIKTINNI